MSAGISFVPYSQNGSPVSYEIACYRVILKNEISSEGGVAFRITDQTLRQILEEISINKFFKLGSFYLKEEEAKQIKSKIAEKMFYFTVNISHTPDIIPIEQAAIYSATPSGICLTASSSQKILDISQYIESQVLPVFQDVDLISKKKSPDFENPELPAWFQYLAYQSLYLHSMNKLLKIILGALEDKTPPEKKIERMLQRYNSKAKEKLAPEQYPVTFRNAAANFQISDLWFLIKENKVDVNDRAEGSQKTALDVAIESKKQNKQDQLETCLLLLECKADPNLPDDKGRTAKHSNRNPVLSLLFERMETDQSKPHEIVQQIKQQALKLGFGGSSV